MSSGSAQTPHTPIRVNAAIVETHSEPLHGIGALDRWRLLVETFNPFSHNIQLRTDLECEQLDIGVSPQPGY